MTIPNHTTGLAELDAQISTLVPATASAVWRAAAPVDALPDPGTLPLIVFSAASDYTAASTDTATNADTTLSVWIIRHRRDGSVASDACAAALVALLERWTPTVAGVGTNPLVLQSSGDGQYDDEYAADLFVFRTLATEA